MHFGVFPYSKFDQTRSDHKSAKSARTGRRFCTSLALVSLKRIWTSLVWRNHVAKKRVQWWLRWWFFLNEEKYKNYKSILGMLRARPRFSGRRKNRFPGRSRAFLLMYCVQNVILWKRDFGRLLLLVMLLVQPRLLMRTGGVTKIILCADHFNIQ